MTSKEEPVSAQLAASLLSPFVLYMAGRIDAADRRATLVGGGGMAFIAYLLDTAQAKVDSFITFFLFAGAFGIAVFSVLLAGLALFPRVSSADDWPSKIFLGRDQGAGILEAILSSETKALSGMIDSQILLGRILAKKNRYTYNAGIAFLSSFGIYAPSVFLGN